MPDEKQFDKHSKRQVCICCKTNVFRKQDNKKYCKNCSYYIHYYTSSRVSRIIRSLKDILGETE